MERGIPTWEQTLESLLKDERETMNDELEKQGLHSAFRAPRS
jgi:hypothetical protein